LSERISVRDLSTILGGITDGFAFTRNPPRWARSAQDGRRHLTTLTFLRRNEERHWVETLPCHFG